MEQKPNNSQNGGNKPGNEKRSKSSIWITLIIAVAIVLVISSIYNAIVGSQYTQTTYSDFLTAMEEDNLAEVQLQYDRILYLTKEEAAKPAQEQRACYAGLTIGANAYALATELHEAGVKAVSYTHLTLPTN